jgi:hypothetical protein
MNLWGRSDGGCLLSLLKADGLESVAWKKNELLAINANKLEQLRKNQKYVN